MSAVRSGPLAAWVPAWIAGTVSIDEVLDAVAGDDAPHRVAGLDDPDSEGPLLDALVRWRHDGAPVRLVLPVPGDVRGVPGPAEFRDAALEAGEAVIGGRLGLVPVVTDHWPSSAPTTVVWQAFTIGPAPVDPVPLGEVQYDLTTAIRECASSLGAAGVAGSSTGVVPDLAAARRAGDRPNLPPGFPSRAVALLSQTERLQAVLDLALADPAGGAIDRSSVARRTDALRPLAVAVRRARLAAYNALAD